MGQIQQKKVSKVRHKAVNKWLTLLKRRGKCFKSCTKVSFELDRNFHFTNSLEGVDSQGFVNCVFKSHLGHLLKSINRHFKKCVLFWFFFHVPLTTKLGSQYFFCFSALRSKPRQVFWGETWIFGRFFVIFISFLVAFLALTYCLFY